MKQLKLFLFLAATMMVSLSSLTQPPSGMNYQAVLRDDAGEILASQEVEIHFEIVQGNTDGQVVFSETHTTTTNAMGLINLVIGSLQNLADVDWRTDIYFLRVNVDGEEMGTSQLLSVPFALYAKSSADAFSGDYEDLENAPDLSAFVQAQNPQDGDMLFFNASSWQLLPIGSEGQILTIQNGTPQWRNIHDDDNGEDPTTVTDIEGNVYATVIVGEQEWMAENLRTTRYNNGAQIEFPGDDFAEWLNNTTGAYAWYNNDEATFKNTYGALYNFPAVNNGNLCPAGWRVPSVDDWNTLVSYLTENVEAPTLEMHSNLAVR